MPTAASDVSDADLVRRSVAGESLAFAQLVEKHQRLVFGVALSNARNGVEAEDLAQEAFVKAWRDLRRLRDPKREHERSN
jgi:DNA-directed RNA polymerase specialized sigma24 family protein